MELEFGMKGHLLPLVFMISMATGAAPAMDAPHTDPDQPAYVVVTEDAAARLDAALQGVEWGRVEAQDMNSQRSVLAVQPVHLELVTWVLSMGEMPCGGFTTHWRRDQAFKAMKWPSDSAAKTDISYLLDDEDLVQAFMSEVSEARIRQSIIDLSSYVNRYCQTQHGRDASLALLDLWQQMSVHRPDVQCRLVEHPDILQPSVICEISGSGAPDEIVVVGGHLDSTVYGTVREETPAPGADDNASGVAVLTEMLHLILNLGYVPERSVHLMAYAAEEIGLVGSADIAEQYAAAGSNVVGMLQLDMVNYAGETHDMVWISDFTNTAQNQFLSDIIAQYTPYSAGSFRCGYGCSDHASWTFNDYPASMLFEAPFDEINPYIHSAEDTLDKSGGHAQVAVMFAEVTAGFMVELAEGKLQPMMPDALTWIPHLTRTGGPFKTQLWFENAGDQSQSLTLWPFTEGGVAVNPVTLNLEARTWSVYDPADLFGEEAVSHFGFVAADGVSVTAGYHLKQGPGVLAHAASESRMGKRFAIYSTDWIVGFDGLALINPQSETLDVVGIQSVASGSSGETKSAVTLGVNLAPMSKTLIVLADAFPAEPESRIEIQTSQPCVALFLRGTVPGILPGSLCQVMPIVLEE